MAAAAKVAVVVSAAPTAQALAAVAVAVKVVAKAVAAATDRAPGLNTRPLHAQSPALQGFVVSGFVPRDCAGLLS